MIQNLSEFLTLAAVERPELLLGTSQRSVRLDEAIDTATRVAAALGRVGLEPGSDVAVVASNTLDYLLWWMACQFAGCRPALLNPEYPPDLLEELLTALKPALVAAPKEVDLYRALRPAAYTGIVDGEITIDSAALRLGAPTDPARLPGFMTRASDTAGYMTTSGTTGMPKLCVQSHAYFIRLAAFIADGLAIGPDDSTFIPLPLFHINPFGYGFLGGLAGRANIRFAAKFSASRFWADIEQCAATIAFLHSAPLEILKRQRRERAEPHRLRIVFFGDPEFLERFRIPVAASAYGSTEAGGVTHLHLWRRGQIHNGGEEPTHVAGYGRPDVDWRLSDEGEILVRERAPNVLFDGYHTATGRVTRAETPDGWFATGDIGRTDADGRLVFVERRAEAIRVKGEYVPVEYVERRFASIADVRDVAVWKRPADIGGDEVVVFLEAPRVPLAKVRQVNETLAPFMRPRAAFAVASIPRDTATSKVQRRRLTECTVNEAIELDE